MIRICALNESSSDRDSDNETQVRRVQKSPGGGGVNPTDKLICGKSLKTVATFTNFFSTYEIMKITINYTNELTFKDLMNKSISNILQLVFMFHNFINI